MLHLSDLEETDARLWWGLLTVLVGIAVLALVDLAADAEHLALRHVLIEGGLVALALGGAIPVLRRLRAVSAERAELARRLEQTAADAARFRSEARELVAGLAQAIDRQLERWALSAAEKEVALLLLKGLSHKEIAEVRGVSDATVRQQARALYKKAGVGGRADLSAFFLEDLLDTGSRAR